MLIYLFDELPMSFEPLFMKAPRRTAATSNGFSDAYRDVPCTPPARTNGTENVQHAKAIAAIAVARLDMYRLTRASSACAHVVVCELVIRVGKIEAPFPFVCGTLQILSLWERAVAFRRPSWRKTRTITRLRSSWTDRCVNPRLTAHTTRREDDRDPIF